MQHLITGSEPISIPDFGLGVIVSVTVLNMASGELSILSRAFSLGLV